MVTKTESIHDVVVDVVRKETGVLSASDDAMLDRSIALMVLAECVYQLEIPLDAMDWLNGPMTVGEIVRECESAFSRG